MKSTVHTVHVIPTCATLVNTFQLHFLMCSEIGLKQIRTAKAATVYLAIAQNAAVKQMNRKI